MPPGTPIRGPVKRDAPFPYPSFHYFSVSHKRSPSPGSPTGPLRRETPIYGTFYIPSPENSSFPQSPWQGIPFHVPQLGPYGEKYSCHQSHWSIYSCVCQSPHKKEPSYKMGKNIRSLSTEPRADGRPTYDGVWPGSPKGYFGCNITY